MFDTVDIFREIMNAQTQQVVYISNIVGDSLGGGLDYDVSWLSSQTTVTYNDTFQSYGELIATASLSDEHHATIEQATKNQDINLNINYNEFSNHIFL